MLRKLLHQIADIFRSKLQPDDKYANKAATELKDTKETLFKPNRSKINISIRMGSLKKKAESTSVPEQEPFLQSKHLSTLYKRNKEKSLKPVDIGRPTNFTHVSSGNDLMMNPEVQASYLPIAEAVELEREQEREEEQLLRRGNNRNTGGGTASSDSLNSVLVEPSSSAARSLKKDVPLSPSPVRQNRIAASSSEPNLASTSYSTLKSASSSSFFTGQSLKSVSSPSLAGSSVDVDLHYSAALPASLRLSFGLDSTPPLIPTHRKLLSLDLYFSDITLNEVTKSSKAKDDLNEGSLGEESNPSKKMESVVMNEREKQKQDMSPDQEKQAQNSPFAFLFGGNGTKKQAGVSPDTPTGVPEDSGYDNIIDEYTDDSSDSFPKEEEAILHFELIQVPRVTKKVELKNIKALKNGNARLVKFPS